MKNENLEKRAYSHLAAYIEATQRLLKIESKNFDIVIGPANSGVALIYIFEEIGKRLEISKTQKLVLPIFREKKAGFKVDHSSLLPLIKKHLGEIKGSVIKILLVDDEIGVGLAAHTVLDLFLWAIDDLGIKREVEYTIVAEDLGFEDRYPSGVQVRFLPTLKHPLDDIYNVISRVVPEDLSNLISEDNPNKSLRETEIFNIALGLPNKEIDNGKPVLMKTSLSNHTSVVADRFKLQLLEFVNNQLERGA